MADTIDIQLVLQQMADDKFAASVHCRPMVPTHVLADWLELIAGELRAGRLDSLRIITPEER